MTQHTPDSGTEHASNALMRLRLQKRAGHLMIISQSGFCTFWVDFLPPATTGLWSAAGRVFTIVY